MKDRVRQIALVELAILTGIVLSYLWLWQHTFPGDVVVCVLLVTGVTIGSHYRRRESARDLGFRLDNLGRSAVLVASFAVPVLLTIVVLGLAFDWHREPPIERLGTRLMLMPVFGLLQQYLLLGFYYRRAQDVVAGSWPPILLTATLFALLHVPNVPLVVISLLAGMGACWLYRREPNLWILGLAHGALSVTVAMFLARLLPSGLKVGLRALR